MAREWSGLVNTFSESARVLPFRTETPTHVILHTTGSGIVVQAIKNGRDPLAHAAAYYARKTSFTSHYLVGLDVNDRPTVIGIVPESLIAYHVGIAGPRIRAYKGAWRRYLIQNRKLVRHDRDQGMYVWWDSRWYGIAASPGDLIRLDRANGQSIGVDILAPDPGDSVETRVCDRVALLLHDICGAYSIPVTRTTILAHSDVDPIARTTRRAGGWDPPGSIMQRVLHAMSI